jgi:hypothetical protein
VLFIQRGDDDADTSCRDTPADQIRRLRARGISQGAACGGTDGWWLDSSIRVGFLSVELDQLHASPPRAGIHRVVNGFLATAVPAAG